MTEHDVLVGFRLRLFTLADELGNVSAACRAMGVDRSTYYRLEDEGRPLGPGGAEGPRAPAAADAQPDRPASRAADRRVRARPPGLRAHGASAPSSPARSGAASGSQSTASGACSCRVGLNTRAKRLALVARHRDPYERKPDLPPPERHIDASEPGEKVQLDCFFVGRLSGTKGDGLAIHRDRRRLGLHLGRAAHHRAQPARPPHPRAAAPRRRTSSRPPAGSCERSPPTTARSSAHASSATPSTELGARQRFIRAGRPNSNGCVERVQLTILEECWRPAFARSLVPKMTALCQRPRPIPHRLQLRPRPHRAPHPRTRPRRHRLRRPQNRDDADLSQHPGLGRSRSSR